MRLTAVLALAGFGTDPRPGIVALSVSFNKPYGPWDGAKEFVR